MPVDGQTLSPLEFLAAVTTLAESGATDEELSSLARSYGLGPRDVQALFSYYEATGRVPDWSTVDSVIQGVSLGLSDEVRGVLDSLTRPVQPEDAIGAYNAARKLFGAQAPGKATLAEVGGSVATGLLLAPFTGGSSLAGTALRGAALGAVEGAGYANEDRLAGAALGGALGAAAPVAVSKGASALGRVLKSPRRRALEAVGELAQDADVNIPRLKGQIADNVASDAAIGAEPKEVLADYLGDPARRRLRSIRARQPALGEDINETLFGRYHGSPDTNAGGQYERLFRELYADLSPGGDYRGTFEKLTRMQQEVAGPLYERAYRAHPSVPLTDNIRQLLQLPDFQRAWKRAVALARYDGVELPSLEKLLKGGGEVPLQVLDYLKRGLDDYLSARSVKGALGRTRLAKIQAAKEKLLAELDQLAPEYAEARAAYAGPAALKDALEEGRQALRLPPAELQEKFSKMSPSEREAFRLGALQSYLDLMESASDNADLVKRIAGSPAARERLRILAPDEESFQRLSRRLQRETEMVRTKNTVAGGSNTADKLMDVGADVLQHGRLRDFGDMGLRALRVAYGRITRRVDELTAKLLTEQDPARQQAILSELEQLRAAQQHMERLLQTASSGAATGAAAAASR